MAAPTSPRLADPDPERPSIVWVGRPPKEPVPEGGGLGRLLMDRDMVPGPVGAGRRARVRRP
jgi:hypothetical protein